MTIIADLSDLIIEQVTVTTDVRITAGAASPTAPCPCCGTVSKRVHSHYQRTLRDLPASGRPVHVVLQVRRFLCEESTCRRNIFAERFPSLTLPRVKFTKRLQEALREMGFELGGEAGARLGKKLSYPGSPDTILRLVKQTQLSTPSPPRVVGIDDWSWKRGLRFGTLICDLESNRPIDQGFTLLCKKTQGECNSLLFLRGRTIACCISPAQWTSLPRHPDFPALFVCQKYHRAPWKRLHEPWRRSARRVSSARIDSCALAPLY